jgi:hypothetical protein
MDWQSWVDEGFIEPDAGQKACATQTVATAWNLALDARRAYEAGDLDSADTLCREALRAASCALLQSEGYSVDEKLTLDHARKTGEAYFGPTITADLFRCLKTIDAGREGRDHAVKRGVMAASTYAAVVGSRIDL